MSRRKIRLPFRTLAAIVTLLPPALGAQTIGPIDTIGIGSPIEHPEPFTWIEGVRELPDGRVLVADSRQRRVVMIDFDAATAQQITSAGAGPLEHASVGRLLAIGPDTTWLVDYALRRFLVLAGPDATPVGTISSVEPGRGLERVASRATFAQVPQPLLAPIATDDMGRLYDRSTVSGMTRQAPVRRWSRIDWSADTVAFTRMSVPITKGYTGDPRFQGVIVHVPMPFSPQDEFAVLRDGAIVIARTDVFRLAFVAPDGTLRRTDPIPVEVRPVTAADREAYFARASSRPTGRPFLEQILGSEEWPPNKPPFTGPIHVSSDGLIWIPLTPERFGGPIVYDVIATSGRRVARIALPADTEILGLGEGVIYALRRDGARQFLQRYDLPVLR